MLMTLSEVVLHRLKLKLKISNKKRTLFTLHHTPLLESCWKNKCAYIRFITMLINITSHEMGDILTNEGEFMRLFFLPMSSARRRQLVTILCKLPEDTWQQTIFPFHCIGVKLAVQFGQTDTFWIDSHHVHWSSLANNILQKLQTKQPVDISSKIISKRSWSVLGALTRSWAVTRAAERIRGTRGKIISGALWSLLSNNKKPNNRRRVLESQENISKRGPCLPGYNSFLPSKVIL